MKFTRDAVAKLAVPEGKFEHFEWDADLPGFGVRLRGKSKRWVIQYRFSSRQRRESLGDTRKITLEDARKIARNRFAQVELGTDPAADRAKAKADAAAAKLTMALVAERYLASKQRRPSTQRAMERYLRRHWAPLRDVPVGDIKRAVVAAELQRLAQEHGRSAASRARAILSALFTWAMREGLCEANPLVATNDPAEGTKPRDRVLSDVELRAVWRECGDDDFGRIVRLLILTGCRREEIGGMGWSEIDPAAGTMTIPGERTKNHRTHILPLPPVAFSLLPPPREGRRFVFGPRGSGFTAWGWGKVRLDLRLGKPLDQWVLHDLRRTMRTGLGKIGVAPHIAELAINHVRGGVQAIYDRHRYEPEIKAALASWADHVMAIVGGKADGAQKMAR